MDKFRGTGRTTRMLQYAIEKAKEGHYVIVYCGSRDEMVRHARHTMQLDESGNLLGNPSLGAKIEYVKGCVTFERMSLVHWNWNAIRNRGAHPNCITLVDHYTIETHLLQPAVTEMLYRFIDATVPSATEEATS